MDGMLILSRASFAEILDGFRKFQFSAWCHPGFSRIGTTSGSQKCNKTRPTTFPFRIPFLRLLTTGRTFRVRMDFGIFDFYPVDGRVTSDEPQAGFGCRGSKGIIDVIEAGSLECPQNLN